MDGDEHVRALARLDMDERVRLTVDGETVEGVSRAVFLGDTRVCVKVAERDGDRVFRIEAPWDDGWLSPQVDVRLSGNSGFRPLGVLQRIQPCAELAA